MRYLLGCCIGFSPISKALISAGISRAVTTGVFSLLQAASSRTIKLSTKCFKFMIDPLDIKTISIDDFYGNTTQASLIKMLEPLSAKITVFVELMVIVEVRIYCL